ncbi:MAG: DUF1697 domain-containing protein [Planctomycetes bacterium]|nr:DUF1697 domain-containing protein [Planctomycetota bacterium]
MVPTRQLPAFVALLRGINVGGHKRVPMAALRALCGELGWHEVATYIQSGNVVFHERDRPDALAATLSAAIEGRFGFPVPVIVCSGKDWLRFAEDSPFPDAEAERPNLLHLGLAAVAPRKTAPADLLPYCTAGERVAVRGAALWIDYRDGVARSKLTPAVLDRVVGAPVTARNWKTVRAIAAMVRG